MSRISDADREQGSRFLLGIDLSIAGLTNLLRERARMLINFKEILPRAHENFEEHNKVLEPSKILLFVEL
jgi:hypothetical protein